MAKNISYERQINELKVVPSGIKYLEFVNNPENHISKEEKGNNHHIHMRALGGEYGPVVRLSYYNHIKAHLLYAKAGAEGNYSWQYEAWEAIKRMAGSQYKKLTELEKHFLEEGEHWGELMAIANKKHGQKCKDIWDNKSDEEKNIFKKKVSIGGHKRYENPKEREKTGKKQKEWCKKNKEIHSNATKKTWNNPIIRNKRIESIHNRTEKDEQERRKKISIAGHKRFEDPIQRKLQGEISKNFHKNMNNEEKENYNKKIKDSRINQEMMHKGENNIWVNKTEIDYYKKLGYESGWSYSDEYKNKLRNDTSNRRWIHKGEVNKRVKINELDYYLNNGWEKNKCKSNKYREARINYLNKNNGDNQQGSKLMTNGIDKPKRIQKQYIEIKQKEGWYFCDKNGNKKVM